METVITQELKYPRGFLLKLENIGYDMNILEFKILSFILDVDENERERKTIQGYFQYEGESEGKIDGALERLLENRLIKKPQRGVYKITNKGREAFAEFKLIRNSYVSKYKKKEAKVEKDKNPKLTKGINDIAIRNDERKRRFLTRDLIKDLKKYDPYATNEEIFEHLKKSKKVSFIAGLPDKEIPSAYVMVQIN